MLKALKEAVAIDNTDEIARLKEKLAANRAFIAAL